MSKITKEEIQQRAEAIAANAPKRQMITNDINANAPIGQMVMPNIGKPMTISSTPASLNAVNARNASSLPVGENLGGLGTPVAGRKLTGIPDVPQKSTRGTSSPSAIPISGGPRAEQYGDAIRGITEVFNAPGQKGRSFTNMVGPGAGAEEINTFASKVQNGKQGVWTDTASLEGVTMTKGGGSLRTGEAARQAFAQPTKPSPDYRAEYADMINRRTGPTKPGDVHSIGTTEMESEKDYINRRTQQDALANKLGAQGGDRDSFDPIAYQRQLDSQADARFNAARDRAINDYTKDMPFWEKNNMSNKGRANMLAAANEAGRAALSGQAPRAAIDAYSKEKYRQSGDLVGLKKQQLGPETNLKNSQARYYDAQADNQTAEAATRRYAMTPEGQANSKEAIKATAAAEKAKNKSTWKGMPNDVKDLFAKETGGFDMDAFGDFANYASVLKSETPVEAYSDWKGATSAGVPKTAIQALLANPTDEMKREFYKDYQWLPSNI